MVNIIQDVKPAGIASAYAEKLFCEGKVELENAGYSIISLPQFAKLRIEQGEESHISNHGAYTREGFLYVPQKGVFLVRNSPIMNIATEATEFNRMGREFYLTDKQVEESLADSIEIKVKSGETIPTKRFGENKLTAYAFGKEAEKYGEFLKEAGIKEIPVYLANIKEAPFARQVWLHGLGSDSRSGLDGFYRDWDYGYTVRGVKLIEPQSGKTASKISAPNFKDVLKYNQSFISEVARNYFEKSRDFISRRHSQAHI